MEEEGDTLYRRLFPTLTREYIIGCCQPKGLGCPSMESDAQTVEDHSTVLKKLESNNHFSLFGRSQTTVWNTEK